MPDRAVVSVGLRCHSETSLELTVEVLLAPIPKIQRHCFDFHSRANQGGTVHHARACHVLVNCYADLVTKEFAEVSRLSFELSCEHRESQSLRVVLMNLIQHSLDVLVGCCRR